MKFALFNENQFGVVEGNEIVDITDLIAWDKNDVQRSLNNFFENYDVLRSQLEETVKGGHKYSLADVSLRAPVPKPSKIIAAPINYILHQQEMNAALTVDRLGVFLKAPSSIIGPGENVLLPFKDRRVDHEAEIAFVIGKEAKDVKAEDAQDYIFGYMGLMDITVRGKEDRPWRKSFDTFTPIGPWIVTSDEVGDPNQLQMDLWVNDELRQSVNTNEMIYGCYKLLEEASRVMTLYPGDIITTGTPEGVGPIKKGDTVRLKIERIGEFSVNVKEKAGILV
ncbi:fumarylacetoacetate hydrolase family protein [Halalkalibacter krulwichiae]|uniref:Ureidoglycolate lyase n=1 Tax=Halalkalibacter krulwichiae TaxID=199441 RepID=A0A1X9MGP4_9BACI|nr:fumarylacetoacetate hydrolase family protein [Halalkalibacter krulwichiae]ARK32608.1 Ureidoglycolate lyase [Halalkalibacter krulwichiae]